jgi:hypothetical protein
MTSPIMFADQATPAIPAPPAPPALPVTASGPMTLTGAEIRQLQQRRSELSNQLNSAEGRRDRLVEEIVKTPAGPLREGLEERVKLLDQRILQIETDIATTGRMLAMNPRAASAAQTIEVPARGAFNVNGRDIVPLAGMFSVFVLAPLAFALARRIWRGSPPVVMRRDPESDARLERIEQAVDAIAIEVERISEAQRFQNKLLGEGQGMPAFALKRPRVAEPAVGEGR